MKINKGETRPKKRKVFLVILTVLMLYVIGKYWIPRFPFGPYKLYNNLSNEQQSEIIPYAKLTDETSYPFVGLWVQRNFRWVAAAVLPLAFALAGCVAPHKAETQELKANAYGSYVSQMPHAMKEPPYTFRANINYSVEGKKTRTINTPDGPVDIYDPAYDPEIIDRYSDGTTFKRYVAKQAQIPQVRQLSRLGCVKFKNVHRQFYYGDLGTNICSDPSKHEYPDEESCNIGETGRLVGSFGRIICRPEKFDLPLSEMCFAEDVRLDCALWEDDRNMNFNMKE